MTDWDYCAAAALSGPERFFMCAAAKMHWNSCVSKLAEGEARRVAGLPAWDPFPVCQRCGSASASVTYREPPTFQLHSSDQFTAQTIGTLVYVCGYCSFKWETKPPGRAFRGTCTGDHRD